MTDFEYFEAYLESIIRFYIQEAMKKKDWEVLAIDPIKGKVILRRLEMEPKQK